jgi:hypothetical protein
MINNSMEQSDGVEEDGERVTTECGESQVEGITAPNIVARGRTLIDTGI